MLKMKKPAPAHFKRDVWGLGIWCTQRRYMSGSRISYGEPAVAHVSQRRAQPLSRLPQHKAVALPSPGLLLCGTTLSCLHATCLYLAENINSGELNPVERVGVKHMDWIALDVDVEIASRDCIEYPTKYPSALHYQIMDNLSPRA